MYPRNLSAIGRGDCPEQRHGLRNVMLYLVALSTIVGGFIVFSCSSDDNGQVRHANLVGSQEVPPVTTAATGTLTLTISDDHTRIAYQLVTVGPFTSNVRFAHIHIQQPGVNGPVVLFFCTNDPPPTGVPAPQACPTTGGTISGSLTAADFIPSTQAANLGINTFADAVAQILSGGAYANVHTVINPSGEIRAQIGP